MITSSVCCCCVMVTKIIILNSHQVKKKKKSLHLIGHTFLYCLALTLSQSDFMIILTEYHATIAHVHQRLYTQVILAKEHTWLTPAKWICYARTKYCMSCSKTTLKKKKSYRYLNTSRIFKDKISTTTTKRTERK